MASRRAPAPPRLRLRISAASPPRGRRHRLTARRAAARPQGQAWNESKAGPARRATGARASLLAPASGARHIPQSRVPRVSTISSARPHQAQPGGDARDGLRRAGHAVREAHGRPALRAGGGLGLGVVAHGVAALLDREAAVPGRRSSAATRCAAARRWLTAALPGARFTGAVLLARRAVRPTGARHIQCLGLGKNPQPAGLARAATGSVRGVLLAQGGPSPGLMSGRGEGPFRCRYAGTPEATSQSAETVLRSRVELLRGPRGRAGVFALMGSMVTGACVGLPSRAASVRSSGSRMPPRSRSGRAARQGRWRCGRPAGHGSRGSVVASKAQGGGQGDPAQGQSHKTMALVPWQSASTPPLSRSSGRLLLRTLKVRLAAVAAAQALIALQRYREH